MSEAPAQLPAYARRLAALALLLPLLVLALIAAHMAWRSWAGGEHEQLALFSWAERSALTLTPAGQPPREGPGSHTAIDGRHSPLLAPSKARQAR